MSQSLEEFNSESSEINSDYTSPAEEDEIIDDEFANYQPTPFKEKTLFTFPLKQGEPNDVMNGFVFDLKFKKRLVVRRFNGITLIDLREFYERKGFEYPSKKGISLNLDMWEALLEQIPKVNKAIEFIECGPPCKLLEDQK